MAPSQSSCGPCFLYGCLSKYLPLDFSELALLRPSDCQRCLEDTEVEVSNYHLRVKTMSHLIEAKSFAASFSMWSRRFVSTHSSVVVETWVIQHWKETGFQTWTLEFASDRCSCSFFCLTLLSLVSGSWFWRIGLLCGLIDRYSGSFAVCTERFEPLSASLSWSGWFHFRTHSRSYSMKFKTQPQGLLFVLSGV